jgi:hypothetical protein
LVASLISEDKADARPTYLEGLCRAAVVHLGFSGAVIQLMTVAGPTGLCASSDPEAAVLADIAFTTGGGPTRDAFTTRRPVLSPGFINAPDRWPGFTAAAVEAGIGGVFAFPLQVGAIGLGVLTLYADARALLDVDQQQLAVAFASSRRSRCSTPMRATVAPGMPMVVPRWTTGPRSIRPRAW